MKDQTQRTIVRCIVINIITILLFLVLTWASYNHVNGKVAKVEKVMNTITSISERQAAIDGRDQEIRNIIQQLVNHANMMTARQANDERLWQERFPPVVTNSIAELESEQDTPQSHRSTQ